LQIVLPRAFHDDVGHGTYYTIDCANRARRVSKESNVCPLLTLRAL
jgi:hypothetical protein